MILLIFLELFRSCCNEFDDGTPFYFKKRYLIVFLAFLGFFNLYMMRVDLSVAIVAMTKNVTVELEDGSVITKPNFDWDKPQQGVALSAFFYGYICTQFVGGFIASKYGGSLVSQLLYNRLLIEITRNLSWLKCSKLYN